MSKNANNLLAKSHEKLGKTELFENIESRNEFQVKETKSLTD